MALSLAPKTAEAVYVYSWAVPIQECVSVSTASLAVASGDVTIDGYDICDNEVRFQLSSGTENSSISASAVTSEGETITETLYVSIVSSAARGQTVQDVITFALRKIEGDGETPDAARAATAIDFLTTMLALWRISGTDTDIRGELTTATVLNVPDETIAAIKYNLRLQVHSHYGADLSPLDVQMAEDSRRALSAQLFSLGDLGMPATLANHCNAVSRLF